MRFILVFLVFLIFSASVTGQTTYRSTPFQLKKIGVFDPKTAVNKYDVNLVSKEAPFPSGSSKQDRLLRQKIEVSKKFPRNKMQCAIKFIAYLISIDLLDEFITRARN